MIPQTAGAMDMEGRSGCKHDGKPMSADKEEAWPGAPRGVVETAPFSDRAMVNLGKISKGMSSTCQTTKT